MGRSQLRKCWGRGLMLNVVKRKKCCFCVGSGKTHTQVHPLGGWRLKMVPES
nr:MAG TPA: hypothetical protein [Caudoviricetes sp.]